MKRISLSMSLFFVLISLFQLSFAMSQGGGENDVLCRNGSYLLIRSDLDTYQAVVAFVLDRELSRSEKAQIRQIVFEGFETDPEGVKAEIRSLNWALKEVAELEEAAKQEEVRVLFRQQMIDYQARGEENPLVSLVLANF